MHFDVLGLEHPAESHVVPTNPMAAHLNSWFIVVAPFSCERGTSGVWARGYLASPSGPARTTT
jgi:hypothetical protein